MLEIIFVRHGETDWNVEGRVMGPSPVPLNENGKRQAERARNFLKKTTVDAIYTSPHVRAQETAEIIAEGRDIDVYQRDGLSEINYGSWVGRHFSELNKTPEFKTYYKTPATARAPGGESLEEVQERMTAFSESVRSEERIKRVVAVSHADAIKAVVAYYLNMPLNEIHRIRIDNASSSIVWMGENFERVLVVNAVPHLDGFFEKKSLFVQDNK
jgi:alpha-ribazole phosphatase